MRTMKDAASLLDRSRFKRPSDGPVELKETYSDLVKKTAKLIGRSYIVTLRMVEKWEPSYLAALYDDCLSKWRDRGFTGPAHMWWTERKKKAGKTIFSPNPR